MATHSTSQRFTLIDAMRGLGALAIACHHIHRFTPQQDLADSVLPGAVQCLFRNGWVGVQMFFVVAGFVLAYSLRDIRLAPPAAGNFVARRVLRLGMPYWAVLLLVLALNLAAWLFTDWPPPSEDLGWRKVGANFVFLQDVLGLGNITAGTWFVCIDLQLGLTAAVLFLFDHFIPGVRPKGCKPDVFMLCVLFIPLGLSALFYFNLDGRYNAWIIYFFHMPLLGMLAWWALESRIPRSVFWCYAAAMAAGVVYRWQLFGFENKKYLENTVALAVGLVIYVAGRRGGLGKWLSAGWLQYLGRISYSLFLIHYPVSWIVLSAGSRMTGDSAAAAVALLAAALAASIVAAHFFHAWVETPSLRLCASVKRLPVESAPRALPD